MNSAFIELELFTVDLRSENDSPESLLLFCAFTVPLSGPSLNFSTFKELLFKGLFARGEPLLTIL